MKRKVYKKPNLFSESNYPQIVPAVAALSVGGAFAVGAAAGLMGKEPNRVKIKALPLTNE